MFEICKGHCGGRCYQHFFFFFFFLFFCENEKGGKFSGRDGFTRMLDFGQFDFGQFDFGQLTEVESRSEFTRSCPHLAKLVGDRPHKDWKR